MQRENAERRIFTLDEATAMLPQVRRLTADAVGRIEGLRSRRKGGVELADLQSEADAAVQSWTSSLQQLGLEVKGLWLVDFDNGAGYYCWRWPMATMSEKLLALVRTIIRRPPRKPKTAGPDHYYKPYWSK
jgi:hypothetical protein